MKKQEQKGFSLIELLIVVAIILIIAAIAIPNLLRARMAANESSAVGSMRTINTGEVTYATTYPLVGFSPTLLALGGAANAVCVPAAATACLIDNSLSSGVKSGYNFTATSVAGGPPTVSYIANATPTTLNQTGIRAFCSYADAVVRVQPAGTVVATVAACQVLSTI
jgi:type IV pilus assembly protein PilA